MIADEEARENWNIIMDNFKDLSENPEKVNLQHMWKVCKKLWPKIGPTLPTAKRNHMGKIVTGPRDIKNVLAKEYKDRLRSRPVRPDLKIMMKRKKKIFKMKIKHLGCTDQYRIFFFCFLFLLADINDMKTLW